MGGITLDELERQLGEIEFDIYVDMDNLIEDIKKELD